VTLSTAQTEEETMRKGVQQREDLVEAPVVIMPMLIVRMRNRSNEVKGINPTRRLLVGVASDG
jgi:hypothetical protein